MCKLEFIHQFSSNITQQPTSTGHVVVVVFCVFLVNLQLHSPNRGKQVQPNHTPTHINRKNSQPTNQPTNTTTFDTKVESAYTISTADQSVVWWMHNCAATFADHLDRTGKERFFRASLLQTIITKCVSSNFYKMSTTANGLFKPKFFMCILIVFSCLTNGFDAKKNDENYQQISESDSNSGHTSGHGHDHHTGHGHPSHHNHSQSDSIAIPKMPDFKSLLTPRDWQQVWANSEWLNNIISPPLICLTAILANAEDKPAAFSDMKAIIH